MPLNKGSRILIKAEGAITFIEILLGTVYIMGMRSCVIPTLDIIQ